MADLDLSELSDKEVDALQAAINRKKRNKIDWDNMTHDERAMYNKTIDPKTHQHIHYEFPKTVYGKWPDGVVKSATIKNAAEESALYRSDPTVKWEANPMAHGVETSPSPAEKNTAAGFTTIGLSALPVMPEPVVEPPIPAMEHPLATVRRTRGPNKPKEQKAA